MDTEQFFENIPVDLPEELVETIIQTDKVRVERIVSRGHQSPDGFWYDQDEYEWVMILQGHAKLEFEDGVVELKKGGYLLIPPHKKHRVAWTDESQDTIWLAVFYRS